MGSDSEDSLLKIVVYKIILWINDHIVKPLQENDDDKT